MDYQCTQAEEIERQREYERLEIEREKSMQEFTDTFKEFLERMNIQRKEEEKRIFEEAARQGEEKRISKEKEAAELEAKHKIQECLNIEEKSIPQASTRSRKFRIDPTLRNFTISTKRIPFSTVETVNSLKMGDKHLDTQKGSLESSVKDPIPIPSESDVISDGDCDDYQKRFDLKVQQLWMPSIYDENNKIRECYIIRPSAMYTDLPFLTISYWRTSISTLFGNESANTFMSSVEGLSLHHSLSPLPIPIEDSDSLMEEIDLFLASDDSMPPGIEIDDYDSEGDIRFLEELLSSDSPPFPKMSHFLLIILMILLFPVLLQNHRMSRFALIWSPMRVQRIENEANNSVKFRNTSVRGTDQLAAGTNHERDQWPGVWYYRFVCHFDDEIRRGHLRDMLVIGLQTLGDTNEIYGRLDDAQDDRSLMSGRLNMLFRDRRAHARTTLLMEREAILSREA
ncbi:hypothetical protein Tco_0841862 [Tanacetum coccineum]|uniref:Uncharacterized protein n=1 Tax=Tanacetum coccineum TaxID=301880 RepID=A0ABQ5AXK7_9ASTR